MLKFLRVPERLFSIVMALVSIAFAAFLIGLGSKVVADLPRLEERVAIEDHVQPPGALRPLRAELTQREREQTEFAAKAGQARLTHTAAVNAYASARKSFDNWLSTRTATTDPAQDPQVIQRTRELDTLEARRREAQVALEALDAADARLATAHGVAARARVRTAARRAAALRTRIVLAGAARVRRTVGADAAAAGARRLVLEEPPRQRLLAAVRAASSSSPRSPSSSNSCRTCRATAATFATRWASIATAHRRPLRHQGDAALPGASAQAVAAQTEAERRGALDHEACAEEAGANICPGCERPVMTTGQAAARLLRALRPEAVRRVRRLQDDERMRSSTTA